MNLCNRFWGITAIVYGACFFITSGWASTASAENPSPPNVLLLLVDDLGWTDLACYGSEFYETPAIDRLAEQGIRFTQAYSASPVCSPSRACLITGLDPVRVDITDWIPGVRKPQDSGVRFRHVDDRDELALEHVTIAERLRAENYQTWFLGKWHLGGPGHSPTDQGFDVNIGGCDKGSPPGGYYAPWTNPNLKSNRDGEYLTERLTDEANKLLTQRDTSRPFFMMMSYYNVHSPIQPDQRSIARWRSLAKERFSDATPYVVEHDSFSRTRQDNPAYASMVGAVDRSVGRILDQIRELGIDGETLVIFTSDNGGFCTAQPRDRSKPRSYMGPTSILPLRSGKGWLYEGGIRIPLIMRLPNRHRAGQLSEVPTITHDIAPTILDLALSDSQPLNREATIGKSVINMADVSGQQPTDRTLYWHYPHYHGNGGSPCAAIRHGNWKLIEFYETDQTELYDLSSDLGEQHNLVSLHRDVRDRLRAQLRDWQAAMSAKMPQPFSATEP